MDESEMIRNRLINQQIAGTRFQKPQEIAAWMIAMQAQDFAMAKWAIGLRLPGLSDMEVENAFNEGSILRTHLMRPTWHFVTPGDIRWLLALTAPHVHAANAYYYRKFELDTDVLRRSQDILERSLRGGRQLTREVLKLELEQKGITAEGLRLVYIIMHAELDGIICSGARQGKQFTYALLEERVPPVKKLEREEALAEFTRRYFISRGPATVRDFAYWSGLTMKDAKASVEMLKPILAHERIAGQEYLYAPIETDFIINEHQTTFLMPDYDEYGMSYKDRRALAKAGDSITEYQAGNVVYSHMIVIDGFFGGTWRKEIKGKNITIMTEPVRALNEIERQEIDVAIDRFRKFSSHRLVEVI